MTIYLIEIKGRFDNQTTKNKGEKMKKVTMIVIVMVVALVSIGADQTQASKRSSYKIYSIDSYDGYYSGTLWKGSQPHSVVINDNLKYKEMDNGYSITPFITFEMNKIDMQDLKSLNLHIYQMSNSNTRKATKVTAKFWIINDTDYSHLQNCTIVQNFSGGFGLNYPSTWEPEGCGYRADKSSYAYSPLRLEHALDKSTFDMNRTSLVKDYYRWSSSDILPLIKEIKDHYEGKKYLTISFEVEDICPKGEFDKPHKKLPTQFMDGNQKNEDLRPYIEIEY